MKQKRNIVPEADTGTYWRSFYWVTNTLEHYFKGRMDAGEEKIIEKQLDALADKVPGQENANIPAAHSKADRIIRQNVFNRLGLPAYAFSGKRKTAVLSFPFLKHAAVAAVFPLMAFYPAEIQQVRQAKQETATAQQKPRAKSLIAGTVVDEKGEPIIGAIAVVLGLPSIGATTDTDGKYVLTDIPAKKVSVQFSLMGYETLLVEDITVAAGKTTPLSITLKEAAQQLGEVVVTAKYSEASNIGLFARQRESIAMTDGISAEQMKLTADNNVAQVLKRVSGVTIQNNRFVVVRGMAERYNNVQLNGSSLPSTEPNRRNFSFDVIPSNLVDNVVVAKTFTPDMSGEFAGGIVQVSTLSIPEKSFFTVNAGSGFNTQSTGKDFWSNTRYKGDWLLGSDDRNWFKDGWIDRFQVAEGQERRDIAAEIPNHWGLQHFTAQPTMNGSLSGGVSHRLPGGSTLGFVAAATYRHEESVEDFESKHRYYNRITDDGIKSSAATTTAALVNAGWKNANHKVEFRNVYNRRFTHDNSRQTEVDSSDLPARFRLTSSVRENTLFQSRLQGEHKLLNSSLKLDWFADINKLERSQPDDRFSTAYPYTDANGNTLYNWRVQYGGPAPFNLAGMYASLLEETKKNIGGNAEYSFTLLGNTQKLKAGYWGTFRVSDFKQAMVSLGSNGNNIDKMDIYPTPQDFFSQENIASGYVSVGATSLGSGSNTVHNANRYAGEQDVHASYLMADLSFFNRLHLTGGVRMEKTRMTVDTYARFTTEEGYRYWRDTVMVYPNTEYLPAAALTFDITGKLKFRAAYSETLARADFRERSASVYFDLWEQVEMHGNGAIKDAASKNTDLRIEYYPSPGEIISAGVFRKNFENPVEQVAIASNDGPLIFYLNLEHASVKGIEINARKHFGFIAPALENLYLNGNLTLMDGASKLESTEVEGNIIIQMVRDRLPIGLSPLVWNVGLSYDGVRFGAAVSYNYTDYQVRFAGVGQSTDEFIDARGVLDAQISYRLFKRKVEIKVNASDLLATPIIYYTNNRYKGESGEWCANDGFDDGYNEGEDRVLRKAWKGRSFSASVSYKF